MRKLVLSALLLGCFAGCGAPPEAVITMDEYNQLAPGTGISQAQMIIGGQGKEVSSGNNVITYQWKNPDGSSATAVFKGDQLISKTQTGLK